MTLVSSLAIAWVGTTFVQQSSGMESDSSEGGGTAAAAEGVNLAGAAEPSSSYVSGDTTLGALHDGDEPRNSRVRGRGSYGNWPRKGTQ